MRSLIVIVIAALLSAPSLSFADPVPMAADISVSGASLFDLASQARVLGAEIPFNRDTPPFSAAFRSKDGRQVLTVFTHPGSVGDIAEFRISYARGLPRPLLRISDVESFTTGKGISLGQSETQVISILGTPPRHSSKGTFRTIEYRIEDNKLNRSSFLAQYNMPIYYGIYTFKNDQLVAFQFGFEYP